MNKFEPKFKVGDIVKVIKGSVKHVGIKSKIIRIEDNPNKFIYDNLHDRFIYYVDGISHNYFYDDFLELDIETMREDKIKNILNGISHQ